MSFAFMPLYTGDYRRDTMHLSCSEHGIYCCLLMYSWDQKGPVPLDERKQAAIVNARSGDELEAMRRVLQEFFTLMDDGWYQKRMQLEIERAHAIGLKRKIAGAKGYQAKAKQLPSKSSASAKQEPLQPQPHSQPQLQETPPTPPAESTPKKAGGGKNLKKDFKYPEIPPYVHDEWIDREFKAGRLKPRYGETYEEIKSRLIAEREASK